MGFIFFPRLSSSSGLWFMTSHDKFREFENTYLYIKSYVYVLAGVASESNMSRHTMIIYHELQRDNFPEIVHVVHQSQSTCQGLFSKYPLHMYLECNKKINPYLTKLFLIRGL